MSSDSDEFDSFPELTLSSSFYERLNLLEQAVPSGHCDVHPVNYLALGVEDGDVGGKQIDEEAMADEVAKDDGLNLIESNRINSELKKRQQLVNEDEPAETISPSLFNQFRKRGFFSITDLTAPTWCEVQYQYGLLGKRHLPPSERPTSILTPKGNVIELDTSRAVQNHKTMEQGTKIHAALEREIHPVQIEVKVSTREETWALRIITMLSSLEALLTLGICREMPVMGFINGFLVMGIIDEIQRRPISSSSSSAGSSSDIRSSKEKQPLSSSNGTLDAGNTPITNWLKPKGSSSKAHIEGEIPEGRRKPMYTLSLSDSKTRQTRSLPKEDASLAGKLQVQAYKLLLDNLLLPPSIDASSSLHRSSSPTFDATFSWPLLFSHLGLDRDTPLSLEFQQEAQVVIDGNGLRFFDRSRNLTLGLLTEIWDRYADLLQVDRKEGCDRELSLVYRWQFAQDDSREAVRKKSRERATASDERRGRKLRIGEATQEDETLIEDETGEEEAEELKRAIAISLEIAKEEAPPPRPLSDVPPAIIDVEEDSQQRLISTLPSSSTSSTEPSTTQSSIPSPSPDIPNIFQTARTKSPQVRTSLRGAARGAPKSRSSPRRTSEGPAKLVADEHVFTTETPTKVFTPKALTRMKRTELQTIARDKGLSPSGLKAQLVDRLKGLSVETQTYGTGERKRSESPSENKRTRMKSPEGPSGVSPDSCARAQSKLSSSGSSTSSSASSSQGTNSSHPKEVQSDIIGVIRFTYSARKIKSHLEDILGFWLGEREPRGVALEHTSRCDWCEFKDGCEWREGQRVRLWEELQEKRKNKGQKIDW